MDRTADAVENRAFAAYDIGPLSEIRLGPSYRGIAGVDLLETGATLGPESTRPETAGES